MDLPPAHEWYHLPAVSRLGSPPVLAFVENGIVWHIGRTARWVRCWAGVYEGETLARVDLRQTQASHRPEMRTPTLFQTEVVTGGRRRGVNQPTAG